jgi:ABC-type lipoprotein release transport system permease subunit
MLFATALRIIIFEKEKFSGAVAGVALATFLLMLQCGFYFGYDRDITIVLDSIDADIWMVPKNQPMFDGWDLIDDLPFDQLRGHQGVAAVSRLIWGRAPCRIPATGGKDSVEVLGVEFDSGIGLRIGPGSDELASLLRPDGHIMVGSKDREKLGITEAGRDGVEIFGRHATTVGFVDDIHLFTTAGFILTDFDNARAFLRLPQDHASYVVCKCRPGADVGAVLRDLRARFPEHDVLASRAFHDLASEYWSSRTGIGPVLMLSAVLAALVGFLIVMLVFYISTIEKAPVFACMKALGASGGEVVLILVAQVGIVFLIGCVLAGLGIYGAHALISRTSISIVITPNLVLAAVGTTAICSALSSLLSIRKVISTDPGEAFRT